MLLARSALVQLCSAKPTFEMFAIAIPQLFGLMNEGVRVPGETWRGATVCREATSGPVGSKGLPTRSLCRDWSQAQRKGLPGPYWAFRWSRKSLWGGVAHTDSPRIWSKCCLLLALCRGGQSSGEPQAWGGSLWLPLWLFQSVWRLQGPGLHWSNGDRRISPT